MEFTFLWLLKTKDKASTQPQTTPYILSVGKSLSLQKLLNKIEISDW
jgi:hypothetical protein